MRNGKSAVAIVAIALVASVLGLLAGGGIYRTVNVGRGDAYIVNRFTGRTFPVRPRAPEAKLDPAAEAIDLVKRERASRFFSDAGAAGIRPSARIPLSSVVTMDMETVEQYLAKALEQESGQMRVIGWKAARQADGLYVVSFRAAFGSRVEVWERRHAGGGARAQSGESKADGKGLGWEVDVENRIVRFISDDPELARHYGFTDSGSSGE